MMESILILGFLAGMRHATEADHVAAVASLSAQSRSRGQVLRLGLLWGVGHTVTLFVVGLFVLSLNTMVPDHFSHGLEFVVGVMLVLLGGDLIVRLIRERVHFHVHGHGDGMRHFHAHSHAGEKIHRAANHQHPHGSGLSLRSLVVGMIHGLAGSAALIVIALQTVPSVPMGLAYIGVFGVGSILGMGLLSTVISVPMQAAARSMTWLYNGLKGALGALTVFIGITIIIHQGGAMGLF